MKVLANKLNLTEATEMIKGTDLAMYRMAWIEEGFHPAQVALGFDEDGDLYDIAEDENYVISQEDVVARDWVVIAVEDGETIGETIGDTDNTHEMFDEAVVEILHAFRKMQNTRTNLPRCKFFGAIAGVLISYFGEETMDMFMETGELVHDDKCICPACEQARFEANPKEFASKKLDEAVKELLELLEEESELEETPDIDSHGDELFSFLSAILGE